VRLSAHPLTSLARLLEEIGVPYALIVHTQWFDPLSPRVVQAAVWGRLHVGDSMRKGSIPRRKRKRRSS